MKVGIERSLPPCACTSCGKLMDAANNVSIDNSDHAPEPGAFTICIDCGHILAFADDLTLRDLTDKEIVLVAGDKRIIAVQAARTHIMHERAYVEDFVRETVKQHGAFYTHERINEMVEVALTRIWRPSRPLRPAR